METFTKPVGAALRSADSHVRKRKPHELADKAVRSPVLLRAQFQSLLRFYSGV
jgi:hypothetical protein